MRVTYIHQHFKLPSEGGGSRPYQFARRLAAEGHTVTMICGDKDQLSTEVDGIYVRRLKVPYRNSMSVSERMFSFLKFMIMASIVSARTKADVIYASSTPLTVAVPGIIGKLFQRAPLIFEVRDLWPSVPIELGFLNNPVAKWIARALEIVAYKASDSVVALSPGMRDGVLEVVPTKRTVVIPNACDFELFDKSLSERKKFRLERGWDAGEVVVVYAGGFGPTYQLDWVIKLAAAVRGSNIRFVLLGAGKDSDDLQNLGLELGLDPNEIFMGMQPKDVVAAFVASGDIVLSALRDEKCLEVNSLNKVFDGLAAGKPILLNHQGWLRDEVVNASAGWQLDRSIDVAAGQLQEIVKNKERMKDAENNSKALGMRKFERDQLFSKFLDELESATQAKTSLA